MERSKWLIRFLECYRATIDLLERIKQEADYDYKKIKYLNLSDDIKNPSWHNCEMEIGYNNDPEALAHELAHGLHEKIRETGVPDKHGEEFADAIRYYVEEKLQTNSKWFNKFNKGGNPFINHYNLINLIRALKTKGIFKELGWE